jgi:hypothetical protein
VLIVNCYLDDTRRSTRRTHKVPQALAPVFLAAAFASEACDARLYSELFDGPLNDAALLGETDMLVLTGLTNALDRMRQLTAYARTVNPAVIVVAGGHAVRAFPKLCRRIFDYACSGDADDLLDVVRDAFGVAYVAAEPTPRYDLANWIGRIGYAEASRGCNFRCGFCTLTAEQRGYMSYEPEVLERQLVALGRRDFVMFLDNNFSGPNRTVLRQRFELLGELHRAGRFRAWGALVTSDFLMDDCNLELAHASGCRALFSGVESFDQSWLERMDKKQNMRIDPADMIRRTLAAGIMFSYGLVHDIASRRVADLRAEIETMLRIPDITLPAYISAAIPLPGTPFFKACVAQGRLLPRTRVRDLDGSTLSLQPLDPVDEVVGFVRDIRTMRGYRLRIARQVESFLRHNRKRLSGLQLTIAAMHGALLSVPDFASAPVATGWKGTARTYLSTTDCLDPVYRPSLPVAARHRHLFEPVMLTDAAGRLAEDVEPDLTEGVAVVGRTARPDPVLAVASAG